MPSSVPFEYLAHCLTVPATVCGLEARFVFDTGIGVTLISQELASRVGCTPTGERFTGRRMSGQEVTLPMGVAEELQIAGHLTRSLPVGVFDMHAMAGLEDVEGFISLTPFRDAPVTVEYAGARLVVEDDASLAARVVAGVAAPVDVELDGPSTTVMLELDIPERRIAVEVDTGSDVLILDERFASGAGVDLREIEPVRSTDETGHEYARFFSDARGRFSVAGAPAIGVTDPPVMFQRIIHDGLVGDRFLRGFTTTYDLAGRRLIFAAGAG